MNCNYCDKKLVAKQKRFCSAACKNKHYVTAWRRRTKIRAIEYLGGACKMCGYNTCVAALIFHHPGGKTFGISHGGNCRSWDRIKAELDKCVLLCLNCHAEAHH